MSAFIDKLNRLSRAVLQPIGFRTAQPASPKPRIQLVASLAQENAESLVDRIAGADAGLLTISELGSGAKALQKITQAVSDIPWGGWLWGGDPAGIKDWLKTGCDFVVFTATGTPLVLLQKEGVGKILEVEASLGEGLLRAANQLPIDAVLVASEAGDSLTWQHLMLFQRFADLLTKPLLVPIPAKVTADELQALWAAGVDGVILAVSAEQPADRLRELRQIIDELPFPLPRKRERAEPLLLRTQEPGIVPAEEEEE